MKHTKLEFNIRNSGEAESAWPQYRIDTESGITVAEIFGDANQDLGRVLAAAPELLEAARKALSTYNAGNDPYGQEQAMIELENAIAKATGQKEGE